MVERRADNAIPALRMTAAEFNAARAASPGADLRKMDTKLLEPKHADIPAEQKAAPRVGNVLWPWLPPGFHGGSPELQRPVPAMYDGGTCSAKCHDEMLVSVQSVALPEGVTTIGDYFVTTLFLTKSQARVLAAQLLNAAK